MHASNVDIYKIITLVSSLTYVDTGSQLSSYAFY